MGFVNRKVKKTTRFLREQKKFSSITAIVIALVFASIGAYTLRGGSAQEKLYWATIFVHVRDIATGQDLVGAGVSLSMPRCNGGTTNNSTTVKVEYPANDPRKDPNSPQYDPNQNPSYGTNAQFWGCLEDTAYTLLNVNHNGYYFDPKAPNKADALKPGQTFEAKRYGNNLYVYMTKIPPWSFSISTSEITLGTGATAKLTWSGRNDKDCTTAAQLDGKRIHDWSSSFNWSSGKPATGSANFTPTKPGKYDFLLICDVNGSVIGLHKTLSLVVKPAPVPAQPTQASPTNSTTKKTTAKKPTTKPAPSPAIVSNTNSDDKVPPGAPNELKAETKNDKMLLSWSEASDNVGVVGYALERSVDGLEWEYIAQNVQDTEYYDESTEPDTYYFYRVRALDAAGNQSEATFSEAVLSSAIVVENSSEPAKKAEKKGSSSGLLVGVIILFVLVAIAIGVWLLRRRRAQASEYYDYNTMPQQSLQTQAPLPPQGTAEHTGQSLKDMVLQDYHPEDDSHEKK